jgi:flagellar hook-associated protein 2
MGTVSSTSASSGATSFNGTSTYAAQLQQVINTAVSNASIPIQQLQTQETTLNNQQSELQTVSNDFQALQTALNSITSATGSGAYQANVTNSSIASASVSSGVMPGNYQINVVSLGSQTNTLSADGLSTVSDPSTQNIDSGSSYTLTVNGQQYSVSDPGGTLQGLANAINASGADVQATIINVGDSSSPDYRLSIQSTNYSPDTVQLSDGQTNLLQTLNTGSYVTYQVNGEPSTPISSASPDITISPGLTATLQQTGSTTITVSQNASNISSALNSFVSAYNAIVSELANNRGQSGGALSGQSIIYDLQSQLSSLASYSSGSGAIASLSDLGITFNEDGTLSFDSSTFASAAAQDPTQVLSFLGSSTSGFLQAATNTVSSAIDPTTGMLTQSSSSLTQELSDISTQISNDQTQVSNLQQSLTQQMATADATISSLQSQLSEMTSLFTDMQQNQLAQSGY